MWSLHKWGPLSNYGPSIHRFCFWKTRCGTMLSFHSSYLEDTFEITTLYRNLRASGLGLTQV